MTAASRPRARRCIRWWGVTVETDTPNPLDSLKRDTEVEALRAIAESRQQIAREGRKVLRKMDLPHTVDTRDALRAVEFPETGDAELDKWSYLAAFYTVEANAVTEACDYHTTRQARERDSLQRWAQGLDRFVTAEGDRYTLDALTDANRRAAAQPRTLAQVREEGSR